MFGKKKNMDAEKEVEKTLGLLGSGPFEAPPFFYTRLKARLKDQEVPVWEQWFVRQLRPALAVAGVTLLLLVNLYCVWKASEQVAETQRAQAATSIAEDYEFTINQY